MRPVTSSLFGNRLKINRLHGNETVIDIRETLSSQPDMSAGFGAVACMYLLNLQPHVLPSLAARYRVISATEVRQGAPAALRPRLQT